MNITGSNTEMNEYEAKPKGKSDLWPAGSIQVQQRSV